MLQPVFLVSDICVYILFLAMLLILWQMRRTPQYRDVLQRIVTRPLGSCCIIILGLYITIGFLDSIHYRTTQNNQYVVMSALDKLLSPLGQNSEQTYSEPFAYHLYSKQSINEGGKVVRDYPHLKHVAANINSTIRLRTDLRHRFIKALLLTISFAIPGFLILLFFAGLCKRQSLPQYFKFLATERGKAARYAWVLLLLLFFIIMQLQQFMYAYHILGTNQVGYDIFYIVIKSIRTALIIGIVTTIVMLPFAVCFGLVAGYFGGWFDDLIQYIYTTVSSIPGVLLISAVILSLQVFIANHANWFTSMQERADARILALCIVLGLTGWTGLCRLIRGESIKMREQEFVLAARSMGVSSWRILWRHLLPNVIPIILITFVLDFSGLVLAEAVLSYVGVGVDPTTYSWGNMINGARLEMARSPMVWWPLLAAFVFMFVLVLCANLFSDVVRDAFDPRLHNVRRDN